MTTHTKIDPSALRDFDPISGVWDSSIRCSEDRDPYAIAAEIAAVLSCEFDVEVKLFRADGRAIGDICPDKGTFLAIRKLSPRGSW